jgi:hypothetical protein
MSNNALEFIENNSINAIIDTRLKTIENNEVYFLTPEKIDKLDNIKSKKHLRYNPIADNYVCIKNEKFELIEVSTQLFFVYHFCSFIFSRI